MFFGPNNSTHVPEELFFSKVSPINHHHFIVLAWNSLEERMNIIK